MRKIIGDCHYLMPAAAVDSHIQPGSSGPALDPVETAVAEGVAKVELTWLHRLQNIDLA
jgi:hypothetical protein